MLCEWECDVGELFLTVLCEDLESGDKNFSQFTHLTAEKTTDTDNLEIKLTMMNFRSILWRNVIFLYSSLSV